MRQAFDWLPASPESQSVSRKALDELKDRLAAANTKAFLVVRNDRVILGRRSRRIELVSDEVDERGRHHRASRVFWR